jgi:hypothetical protein
MIGRCDEQNFEQIGSIINDGVQAYSSVIPPDCRTEPYMSKEELSAELGDGVSFWGHDENGTLQGFMGIKRVDDATLIRHACVRTASRQQGIGGRLLTHLPNSRKGQC